MNKYISYYNYYKKSNELTNVLKQLKIRVEIIEIKTFSYLNNKLHLINFFKENLMNYQNNTISINKLDTIVVPLTIDGF